MGCGPHFEYHCTDIQTKETFTDFNLGPELVLGPEIVSVSQTLLIDSNSHIIKNK